MATFVLVPGAWLGGWCWQRVTPLLQAAGHQVYTPTLTGLGERVHLARPETNLDTHIQDIVNLLEFEEVRDVVLLGHSYGGAVVTGVADRAPERLRLLVYLDTGAPPDGKSLFDLFGPERTAAVEAVAREQGDGWRWPIPPAEALRANVSMAGVDEADMRWLYAKCTPQPLGTFRQPIRLTQSGPPPYGRALISCTAERSGPNPLAEHARTSPDWLYRELSTGHWPMFSMPSELAGQLSDLTTASTPAATAS